MNLRNKHVRHLFDSSLLYALWWEQFRNFPDLDVALHSLRCIINTNIDTLGLKTKTSNLAHVLVPNNLFVPAPAPALAVALGLV